MIQGFAGRPRMLLVSPVDCYKCAEFCLHDPLSQLRFRQAAWPPRRPSRRVCLAHFQTTYIYLKLCLSSSAKVFFVSHGVPRSVSCYSARTTRTNHRRRRRPAGRRVRRPSDEASPSGRRLARHSSFSITSFSIEPAPPLGGQAAGANSRRCSFNCSLSTSMLRYRMASTQSS